MSAFIPTGGHDAIGACQQAVAGRAARSSGSGNRIAALPTRLRRCAVALAAVMAVAISAPSVASADTWPENGDAGSLFADAQAPVGSGPLDAITGVIPTASPDADEDLYKVCLTGEGFSATTTSTRISGRADPMLYLFDSDGYTVAFHDDIDFSNNNLESQIVLDAPVAGPYYLAIVAYSNQALTASGGGMLSPGDGPFDHWLNLAAYTFSYSIALSGVQPCSPAPNESPDASDDNYSVEGPGTALVVAAADGVLVNDFDADGDALTATVLDAPAHGSVDLNPDGSFSYQPDEGFVGSDSFTYVANDGTIDSVPATVTIGVHYAFGEFLAPIDSGGVLNIVKAGQGVPVKFSLGGDYGLDVLQSATPSTIACDSASQTDTVETTTTADASRLSYNAATGVYTYVWKTDKAWANSCVMLTVTLADGVSHTALFKFTR